MRHIVGFFRVLLPLIALGTGLIGMHYLISNDPGASCAKDFECRHSWNGVCLYVHGVDPYCSRKCTTAADCPASWSCEPIRTERIQSGTRRSSNDTSACTQPGTAGPAGDAPQAESSADTAPGVQAAPSTRVAP